jgi:hypothetical protein
MVRPLIFAASTIATIALAGKVYAADLSVDSSQDQKIGKDKSVAAKSSSETRDSKTKRKSYTKSKGGDSNISQSHKFAAAMDKQNSLDLQLPIAALFLQDTQLWKTSADFGLGGDMGDGVIFATAQEYQAALAKANGKIADAKINESAIKEYLLDVARQGAMIAQAAIYLQDDVAAVGQLTRRHDGSVEIRGLGSDDLKVLAGGAISKASKGLSDARLALTMARIAKEVRGGVCRFGGDIGLIKCGAVTLQVVTPPILKFNGVPWFGAQEGFGGITGSYRVASNWSYSQALEKIKSDSEYSRWASEISTAAEELESRGKSREAIITKRKAVEKVVNSKAGLSVAKFLPNHQQ